MARIIQFDAEPLGLNPFPLAVVTDWHEGSLQFKRSAAERWIRTIADNGWYWLGLGDLTDNVIKSSPGTPYEATSSPYDQIMSIVQMLEPIADRCLGMVGGNHGRRTSKEADLDIDQVIAEFLSVPYSPHALFLSILVDRYSRWKICAHHTKGGGTTMGGKANALHKMINLINDADLYIGGHSHCDIAFSDKYNAFARHKAPYWNTHTRHFSGCGSMTDWGGYAEKGMYPPAGLTQVVHFLGIRSHVRKHAVADDENEVKPKYYERKVFRY